MAGGTNPFKMGMGIDIEIRDAPAAPSLGDSAHIVDRR
jgi:hypothetical protein